MVDIPRRLTLSGADKVAIIADRAAPGSHRGNTNWSKPSATKTPTRRSSGAELQVTVGDTTDQDQSVAITATSGSDSGSIATGFRATAVGWDAEAPGGNSTALGAQTFASGGSSIAVGSSAVAEADSALAIGCGSDASGTPSIAIGTLDSGSGVKATAAGTVAIGADSSLIGAEAHNVNEFVLGTANHIVIVKGKLVIADGSGGLHQIVVSTGGALSTVAYP